jgi:glycosyltransferase involved in cell wall biosynthesis
VPTPAEDLCALRAIAEQAGMRRVHMLAWRDLDDVDAGGSELHAATIARLWAGAGLDVTMRTSEVPGRPSEIERDGYRVIRHGSRYSVFAQASMAEAIRPGSRDGLVEIWNGMPFLSPLWHRGPRSIWIHHFHAEMWQMVLPRPVAAAGAFLERRLAPPLYRRSPIVTLSESSRQELVAELGFDPANVSVVSPGVSRTFSPGGERSTTPLVVAIGRLAPVKRFDVLIDALAVAKERCPGLQAVIVGEGDDRSMLQARIDAVGGRDWLTMPGRLSDSDLVALYQRAWVLASSSAREGWGMTITEAAACGTPAVATDISGHRDAIVRDVSGLLVDVPDLAAAITRVLDDPSLRDRLAAGALARAAELTWESTAAGTLRVLIEDARRRKR